MYRSIELTSLSKLIGSRRDRVSLRFLAHFCCRDRDSEESDLCFLTFSFLDLMTDIFPGFLRHLFLNAPFPGLVLVLVFAMLQLV